MAFPKKNTRSISVREELYDCHLKQDWTHKNRWLVVQKQGTDGQLLFVDPYHRALLPPSLKQVKQAIKSALFYGWTPRKKLGPMRLTYNGSRFIILPDGISVNEQQKLHIFV